MATSTIAAHARVRRPRPLVLAATLVALLLVAAVGAYGVISWRVAEGVTHVKRHPIEKAASVVAPAHEDVSFRTADGLTLRGWSFTAAKPSGREVIMVHGKDQDRIDSTYRPDLIAPYLLANGYGVLVFDLRGHGESDGDRFSLGEYERFDVAAAIDWVASRGIAEDRIALMGESMGAGTILQAVALRPGVGPVIADSGYENGSVLLDEVAPQFTGLPAWFDPGVTVMAKLFFGLDVSRVDPGAVVRAHPEKAYLFIACADDGTVPVHHSADLRRDSANPNSELWVASYCDHVQASVTYPIAYERHVLSFLAKNMP